MIKKHLGNEFVNSKEVDRDKLNEWIRSGHAAFDKVNHNLIKLNNITLPIIKKQLVSLKNAYSLDRVMFVELAIFVNHQTFFHDIADNIIYVTGRATELESIHASGYLNNFEIKNDWYQVDNSGSISQYRENLLKVVDEIIETKLQSRLHI